ncbi:MAG: hypothetical protein HOM15_08310 [Gammaproteobacteria bacterium]|jgi:hypothetical protein|nr:hypothetical protein [Gammaproteobacteria bacterium]
MKQIRIFCFLMISGLLGGSGVVFAYGACASLDADSSVWNFPCVAFRGKTYSATLIPEFNQKGGVSVWNADADSIKPATFDSGNKDCAKYTPKAALKVPCYFFKGDKWQAQLGVKYPEFGLVSSGPYANENIDPIAVIGHGMAFDRDGNEIKLNATLISQAQNFYLELLSAKLTKNETQLYNRQLEQVSEWKLGEEQEQLVINTSLIDWLIATIALDDQGAMKSKNTIMRAALRTRLFEPKLGAEYTVPGQLQELLPNLNDLDFFTATGNSGAAYIAECLNAGVPTPPGWGDSDWRPTGSLSDSEEFISNGLTAKPYVYSSNSPSPLGSCIALPREDTGAGNYPLLGIICLGKETGKSCFWDNQEIGDSGTGINYPIAVGASVPLSGFLGGADLNGGTGGTCTACHAGENPFNIHPNTALGHPALDGTSAGTITTTADVWYDPIVHADWPQNEFISTLVEQPEAVQCAGCHTNSTLGGRFPKLSNELINGYCPAVLKNAINIAAGNPVNTMPQFGVLSEVDHAALVAVIDDFCDGDPANAEGDPHLKTTDGTHYDFHAAGEFTLLKDNVNFEVQTRQSAIPTTFFPGPNNHTGLATCVSVNSAVAAQVGNHRVTYQPRLDGAPDPAELDLRIDGVITPLTTTGVTLSSGGRVSRSSVNGLEIEFPNGELMTATAGYWSSQGKWYMNVNVIDAEANDGILGAISVGDWLPQLPDGSSMGPKPVSTAQRYIDLNETFANAWRVDKTTSLFDYQAGGSPYDFELVGWPKDNPDCEVPEIESNKPIETEAAKLACAGLVDENRFENCVYDVALTGEKTFAETYLQTEMLERWGTSTRITERIDLGTSQRDIGLVAKVKPRWNGINRAAQGWVQFYLNDEKVKEPIALDKSGRAVWITGQINWGKYRIHAVYIPAKEAQYLTSTSAVFSQIEYKNITLNKS